MATEIPVIPTDARLIYERPSDPRDVLVKEMEKRKIPISIGKTCPVKCTFCYEIDHGYRKTEEPGKTTQEDWDLSWTTSARSRHVRGKCGCGGGTSTWSGPTSSSIRRRWS